MQIDPDYWNFRLWATFIFNHLICKESKCEGRIAKATTNVKKQYVRLLLFQQIYETLP